MTETNQPVHDDAGAGQRRAGRRLLLGGGLAAMATGAVLAPGRAEAASGTSPWLLGGNTGVSTDGSNYLGIQNVAPLIFKTATTAGAPAERMRISSTGLVGIGTNAPVARLDVLLPNGTGVRGRTTGTTTTSTGVLGSSVSGTGVAGQHSAATGAQPGVLGETNSTAADAAGVVGRANAANAGATSGVYGLNQGTNNSGVGVYGQHKGGGYGVLGVAATGIGLVGQGEVGVDGSATTGTGVRGSHTELVGTDPGVLGQTESEDDGAAGVVGRANPTNAGATSGVHGINQGTGESGVGVYGEHAGGGYGVLGRAQAGPGVVGQYPGTTGESPGVLGETDSSDGSADARAKGVYGRVNAGGGRYAAGVYGNCNGGSGNGVFGEGPYGVTGVGSTGVYAQGSSVGLSAYVENGGNYALRATADLDVARFSGRGTVLYAECTATQAVLQGPAIYAKGGATTGISASGGAYAGYFTGTVHVQGTLEKSAGSFKIDHPQDPTRRWLSHSFVESPDMMNVYNGNIVLGAGGTAVVQLPDYFTALNRDFRYQLTCIGAPATVYVAKKIEGNQFTIAGGKAGLEVSWQVTGIRQDDYARANPIVVEQDKTGDEAGTRSFVPSGSRDQVYVHTAPPAPESRPHPVRSTRDEHATSDQ